MCISPPATNISTRQNTPYHATLNRWTKSRTGSVNKNATDILKLSIYSPVHKCHQNSRIYKVTVVEFICFTACCRGPICLLIKLQQGPSQEWHAPTLHPLHSSDSFTDSGLLFNGFLFPFFACVSSDPLEKTSKATKTNVDWTRTVENDPRPSNMCLQAALQRAHDWADWRNFL